MGATLAGVSGGGEEQETRQDGAERQTLWRIRRTAVRRGMTPCKWQLSFQPVAQRRRLFTSLGFFEYFDGMRLQWAKNSEAKLAENKVHHGMARNNNYFVLGGISGRASLHLFPEEFLFALSVSGNSAYGAANTECVVEAGTN